MVLYHFNRYPLGLVSTYALFKTETNIKIKQKTVVLLCIKRQYFLGHPSRLSEVCSLLELCFIISIDTHWDWFQRMIYLKQKQISKLNKRPLFYCVSNADTF